MTEPRTYTAEELLVLDDDGFRHELIRGELRTMEFRGSVHGNVAAQIGFSLGHFIMEASLGDCYAAGTGFIVSQNPDTVLAPDFAFVRNERLAEVHKRPGFCVGAPDLLVEVIAPSDS